MVQRGRSCAGLLNEAHISLQACKQCLTGGLGICPKAVIPSASEGPRHETVLYQRRASFDFTVTSRGPSLSLGMTMILQVADKSG